MKRTVKIALVLLILLVSGSSVYAGSSNSATVYAYCSSSCCKLSGYTQVIVGSWEEDHQHYTLYARAETNILYHTYNCDTYTCYASYYLLKDGVTYKSGSSGGGLGQNDAVAQWSGTSTIRNVSWSVHGHHSTTVYDHNFSGFDATFSTTSDTGSVAAP